MLPVKAREIVDASAGWAGDRVVLFEGPDRSRWAVVWELRWDSQSDATEFAELYRRARKPAVAVRTAVVQSAQQVRVVIQPAAPE